MKYIFLTMAALGLAAASFAQKVKVKKGEVLIDDNKVGYLEKSGGLRTGRTYTLKTLDGTTVLIGSQKFAYSLLEKTDMTINYISIEFPQKNSKVGVRESEISFFDDAFAKYFIDKKIFVDGRLSEAAADDFIKSHPDSIPAYITEMWNQEQEYLAQMAELADRDTKKEVFIEGIKESKGEEYGKEYIYDNYELYQDKVLIGYASVRTSYLNVVNNDHLANSPAPAMYFFYNTKHVPVGRLDIGQFGKLRMYNGDIAVGHVEQKFNSTGYPSRESKLVAVAKYFISRNKL